MPQLGTSDAARRIRHMSIELRKNGALSALYTFLLNPEELNHDEPARVIVVQTLGGAYLDSYGLGLSDIGISGTTGFHARPVPGGGMTDGYERFHALRNNVYRRFFEGGAASDDHWQMFFYMWEDNEFWEVIPMRFGLKRSKSRPLLYQYDLRFTGIRKLDSPSSDATDHAQNVDKITANVTAPRTQGQRVSEGLSPLISVVNTQISARSMTYADWKAANPATTDGITPVEQFNATNFPGTAWADSIGGQALVIFLDGLKTALDDWLAGKTPYVNKFYTDLVAEYQTHIVAHLNEINALPVKPLHMRQALQDADRWVSVALGYPAIFKPSVHA